MANRDNANEIIGAANRYGLPAWIPLDISRFESGLNARAVGDKGSSFGLFQLHRGGLAPEKLSNEQLMDPRTNADIAVRAMKSNYNKGVAKGLQGFELEAYVANSSGWPGHLGPAWTADKRPDYTSGLRRVYNDNATEAYVTAYGGSVPESAVIGDARAPDTHYDENTYHSPAANTFRKMAEASEVQSFKDWKKDQSFLDGLNIGNYLGDQGTALGVRMIIIVIGLLFILFAIWAIARQAGSDYVAAAGGGGETIGTPIKAEGEAGASV